MPASSLRLMEAATAMAVAAVALVPVARAEPGARTGAPVAWRAIEPGAAYAFVEDDVRLELLRFDLRRFRASVVVAGSGPSERQTASQVLRRSGAVVAAVNGGFFDGRGRPLGLRVDRGDTLVPFRRRVDWGVFYVSDRRAHIVHSRDYAVAPGTEAAIQVGPRILIDGVVPKLKPQIARRTAVALTEHGDTITLVVAPEPVAADSLGARLAALGYHVALMLDGGPSTQLAARLGGRVGSGERREAELLEIPGAYAVPDLLTIVRR
ncbi:MAG: phosphodiester glycosidase family protein [Deltaproteobacteria bacterium]|jgi:hypothetical protein|nr:phosphodiester glycosidase family protein [Deltaproteobacteria bacterium]